MFGLDYVELLYLVDVICGVRIVLGICLFLAFSCWVTSFFDSKELPNPIAKYRKSLRNACVSCIILLLLIPSNEWFDYVLENMSNAV